MRINAILKQPINVWPLAIFRILFGLSIFYHSTKLWSRVFGYEEGMGLTFSFPGLEFITLLPFPLMKVLVAISFVAAVMVILGWRFRVGTIVWVAISLFFLLLDQLYYNNHYYLFTLLAFLLAFTDADQKLSLKSKVKSPVYVPNWQYLILQLQLFIVYFYGGLAKLNPDWLSGHITIEMAQHYIESESMANALSIFQSWGGLVFDLVIGFLLLYRPTRKIGIILCTVFHLFNGWFFQDIGIFPYTMLGATILLFFPESWYPKAWKESSKKKKSKTPKAKTTSLTPIFRNVFLAFFVFQFLFPLRFLVLSGHPEWTGQAHYFSWRMKSFRKEITKMDFRLIRSADQQVLATTNLGLDHLTLQRSTAMPSMVLPFAHMAKKLYEEQGIRDFELQVDYEVALNGSKPKLAIDPNVNILEVDFAPYRKNEWITTAPE